MQKLLRDDQFINWATVVKCFNDLAACRYFNVHLNQTYYIALGKLMNALFFYGEPEFGCQGTLSDSCCVHIFSVGEVLVTWFSCKLLHSL